MEALIDTSRTRFTVGRPFEPKTDEHGRQKQDHRTRLPLWIIQLIALGPLGADIMTVTVAVSGQPPELRQGQDVSPGNLTVSPWQQNGRAGLAFRADEIRPVALAKVG